MDDEISQITDFLILAKRNTYAAKKNQVEFSRTASCDFLKAALLSMPYRYPFRGPEIYTSGSYYYHCKVDGTFHCFQGYEDIFYNNEKIYECYFHGGDVS